MKQVLIRGAAALLLLAMVPAVALAQASITGVVRDTSGAVLPGVTVEATSPVIIEKVRSATTDGTGRFIIPDLRPGTYRVTFSLPGFRSVVRDELELQGTSVVTANADMAVGAVEETITVSGATPTVDLQSTTRQVSITQEIVSQIPSSRNPFALGVLIPGVTQSFGARDVGGAVVAEVAALSANGGRTNDQRMMVNGVALSSGIGGGWGGGAVPNAAGTQEFAIDVSAVDAQAATGGVRVNFIPRDGGNQFSGTIFGSYSRGSWASDNYTGTDVQQRGLTAPSKIKENGDFNPGVGGPIVRDKFWFFASGRALKADNLVAGQFMNANANDLTQIRYVSTGEQAILHQDQTIFQLHLTYQLNNKNKIGLTYDQESLLWMPVRRDRRRHAGCGQRPSLPAAAIRQRRLDLTGHQPAAARGERHSPRRAVGQHAPADRQGRQHRRARAGHHRHRGQPVARDRRQPELSRVERDVQQLVELEPPLPVRGLVHHGLSQLQGRLQQRLPAPREHDVHEPGDGVLLQLRQRRAVAGRLPHSHEPSPRTSTTTWGSSRRTAGPWVAGRWRVACASTPTRTSFPESSISPTFLAPNLNVSFPKIDNISWKDVTPKLGATYDLFGNGKTALKVTLNKYLEGMGTTGFGAAQVTDAPNPINRLSGTAAPFPTRTWIDANGNFAPDCNLQNYQANGECLRVDERGDLRHRRRRNQLRPGPAQRLGQAVLQLGVHDERPARAGATPVAQRPVRAPVVRQLPSDR